MFKRIALSIALFASATIAQANVYTPYLETAVVRIGVNNMTVCEDIGYKLNDAFADYSISKDKGQATTDKIISGHFIPPADTPAFAIDLYAAAAKMFVAEKENADDVNYAVMHAMNAHRICMFYADLQYDIVARLVGLIHY